MTLKINPTNVMCQHPAHGFIRNIKCCSEAKNSHCFQTYSAPEPDPDPDPEEPWWKKADRACKDNWDASPAATSGEGEVLSYSAIATEDMDPSEWQCSFNLECAVSRAWRVHNKTFPVDEVSHLRCCSGALKTGPC